MEPTAPAPVRVSPMLVVGVLCFGSLSGALMQTLVIPIQSELPEKVYDFAPRRLDEARTVPPPTAASPKQQLRFVLARALPAVAACLAGTNHPAGTVDVTLSIALWPGEPAMVHGARVEAFGDVRLAACIRSALLETDASAIAPPAAAERWTIHAPLLVDANYTGKL